MKIIKGDIYTPNFSAQAKCNTRYISTWSLTNLNSDFSFSSTGCHTKTKELSLPYYLPTAEERIVGFIPISKVLVLCESIDQDLNSTVSISYNDKHYTIITSIYMYKKRPFESKIIFFLNSVNAVILELFCSNLVQLVRPTPYLRINLLLIFNISFYHSGDLFFVFCHNFLSYAK